MARKIVAVEGDDIWYYLKWNKSEPIGPLPSDEMRFLFATSQINRRTLVWTPGMEYWEELGNVNAFQKTERIKPKMDVHGVRITPPSADDRPSGKS
jgi:hypothetical protein